jgi:crossover junction endodeoxyribonuclease RusA
MLAGPIAVRVTFTLHKPTTAPKRRKIWPSKRPDMDKLLRSTFDAIGAAGVWKDDSQVVHTDMAKCYPNEWTRNHSGATAPGALITVTPLEPETRGAE